jgi:hypothetical protein
MDVKIGLTHSDKNMDRSYLIRDGESNKAEKIKQVMRFKICSVHLILG